jgi:HD-GYP domain-containing protein (c-di-GMP phosphodiesterase class II)
VGYFNLYFEAFRMFLTEGIKTYDVYVIFAFLENISTYYIGMNVGLADGRDSEIMYISHNDVLNPIV